MTLTKMKILELFSGYGTASFALKRLGIKHELIGYSDIDKYANQCFQQNHGGKELGDVKKIKPEELEDFDLLTGGFPCQAFSNAGKMQGELDPRGSLFYEIIRIAEVKKPKYMLLENVKGLTCKKFKDTFNKILSELDRIGYNVYWKVLNSKDYGIPQSRARVWFVCFRKDIDTKTFKFPEPVELKIFIKDILEPQVDAKYYLSPLLQERFAKYLEEKESKIVAMRSYPRTSSNDENREQQLEPRDDGCSNTITNVQKDNLVYDRKGFDSRTKGFRESELSPTLSTKMGTGGNNVPMVLGNLYEKGGEMGNVFSTENVSPTITGYHKGDSIKIQEKTNVSISNCEPRECGWQEQISPTLKARDYKDPKILQNKGQLRRLTPKECFRLMGFLNDEINLEGLSDTQRYKLAGNGQDVNMVSLIFKEMLK